MKVIIPSGFEIGHYDDEYTGVSVILAKKGAVAGCDQRGGAPGTRETDLLRPEKMMQKINAVVLSGGSAYGLAASCGVMDYLKENGYGYKTAGKIVPIVSSAVLFDLNQKEYHYPTAEYGYRACKEAVRTPVFGNVGAGKGATVGKIRGLKNACKSGIGAATVKVAGVTITAIVTVNAMGDIWDGEKIVAGAKGKDGSFINTESVLANAEVGKLLFGTNTTIGCILTNANIDKVGANKLASISHNGLARAIRPVHTDYDGDTMFCMSTGKKPVVNFAMLQSATVEATRQAIVNAVSKTVEYEILFDEEDNSEEE
ncbi:MAG: P1 family peptidase [Clostridiales bacterium]|nr:P1 family peptidase [Clostridiales bacterium]